MDEREEFSAGQIAKILNVSRSTVFYWIKKGVLEAHQTLGGTHRVSRETLAKAMKRKGIPLTYLEEQTATRVLVVDDDTDILRILATALNKKRKFKVKTASTIFDAGYYTREFRPHVILLDSIIKGVEREEFQKTLKANPELSETKVISISGSFQGTKEKIKAMGFDAFLQKPFDVNVMIKTIEEIID